MPGPETFPAWSPDGTRLAFACGGPGKNAHTHLCVLVSGGTDVRKVTGGSLDQDFPSFSPDGRRLLFVESIPNSDFGKLKVISADGSGSATTLTDRAVGGGDWSPDGQRIVFTGANAAADDARVWTIKADGSGAQQIGHETTAYEVSWSPDGKLIAYVSPAGDASSKDMVVWNEDVWVMRPDGTESRKVVRSVGNDHWSPAWSPDSTRLAYGADGLENNGQIKVVDLRTGKIKPLTRSYRHAYDGMPDWH